MLPAPARLASCCLIATLAITVPAVAAEGEDIDLEEIVRKPAIGNYRGYAEFKMAHYAAAKRIWEALDARNFGEAAFNLGILHEDGLGVPKDLQRALAYYRRGAENGSGKAVFRLGLLLWLGTPEIPRDPVEGRRYLAIAAADGDQEAARYLRQDEQAAADDPLAAADRATAAGRLNEAFGIIEAAARAGNVRARTRLAWCYEAGRGIGRDLAQAAGWFRLAAEAGDGEAMYALAVMHGTGAGQPQDAAAAEAWLRRSAASGYGPALSDLKAR